MNEEIYHIQQAKFRNYRLPLNSMGGVMESISQTTYFKNDSPLFQNNLVKNNKPYF